MVRNDYYMWLLSKVDDGLGACDEYSELLSLLFSVEYEYAFEMDSNRAEAGENLRSLYAMSNGLYLEDVYQGNCTVLEMLIALSDNLAFDTNCYTQEWFWQLVKNLGLDSQTDENFDENYILECLHDWMDHNYNPDGTGSLFPLEHSDKDCRNMEIWDQMNAYLTEKYPVGNWIE